MARQQEMRLFLIRRAVARANNVRSCVVLAGKKGHCVPVFTQTIILQDV